MKKVIKHWSIIISIAPYVMLVSDWHHLYPINTINLYLKAYPFASQQDTKDFKGFFNTGTLSAKMIKQYFTPVKTSGILASYWGYLNYSDYQGNISFPRKHPQSLVKVLITERIIPILMIGNTIHHWQIDPTAAAQLYSFERLYDTTTKTTIWKVTEQPLPENKRITLDTIVLFAKPKAIYIPTGQFPTTDNAQLLLPDIYVKKGLNKIIPILYSIKIRQFFKPLEKTYKKENSRYFSEQLVL